MNNGRLGFFVLIGITALAACTQEETVSVDPLGSESVASVNGIPIQTALFNYYSRGRLQKNADELTDEEFDLVMDELIEFRLLAAQAEAEGLADTEDMAAQLEIQRLEAMARVVASNHLSENPATEAELQLAYEQNISALSGPQFKARHILVDEETEAQEIIDELQQGADFEELAQTRSTGPSGPSGGDLGWFSAESMVAPFADAIRSLETGTYTQEPVATRFGWHVILLEDAVQQQAPGLDAVRDDITSFVQQRRVEEFIQELRESAEVIIGAGN
jgi:peptidyl-prolyl cis-trans isomerase C